MRRKLTKSEAIAYGRVSGPCDPRIVVMAVRARYDRKPPERQLTRAQLGEWLVQVGIERVLPPPTALLLLRVLSYVAQRRGTATVRAWIGRGTLAAVAGRHRKTIDAQAAGLTGP